jgi:AraC-like DNA-binding protein
MPGSSTRTFLEPDTYEASLRQAQIQIAIASRGRFTARVTWAELHHLQVVQCEENLPHAAYLRLAPQLSFVTFPVQAEPLLVWRGTAMQPEDIIFHSRGERLHQWAPGPCVWGAIVLDPAQIEIYARALSGKPLSRPQEGGILRPSRRDAARLRRLHAQLCRLAETKPKILAHSEVARAIEQGLIQALVACLTTARVRPEAAAKRRHADILIRFEEALAQHLGEPLHIPELCELIGVSERSLRSSSTEFLGVNPGRYVLWRRLSRARTALRDGTPDNVDLTELARSFGFTQLGRFAAAYQVAFGEHPSITLQRAPGTVFAAL